MTDLRRHTPRGVAPALVFGLGLWEALLILGLLILLFGAKRIPGIAKGIGSGIRNFKGEIKAGDSETDAEDGDGRSG